MILFIFIWPAVIGAAGMIGASVGSAALSSAGDKEAAEDAFDYQVALQNRSFDFTREMRATAYQTAVEDLRAAGLNPILAASGPGPASAQSFGTPAAPHAAGRGRAAAAAGLGALGKGIEGVSKAIALKKLKKELEILDNTAQNTYHEVHKTIADGVRSEQEALRTKVERELLETQLPSAQAIEKFDSTDVGQILRMLRRFMQSLTGKGNVQ